ncbi:hypothetical protein M409DRAFT_20871 [Zasmidium cellare ATCC 36951]|uniref:Uncharacterized protein n=1 Tax=Zasmidium cellare ATCC 36951 TaxID=1080233 RepID=A0A6A6CRQ5_ZASCE|nr:uncharacterized protein M409DRAFT_20871 [Zasmidium cellare ATCC 36951]KAF2168858.1 hypothetical protein M409DRAFT_20871 [Zasmidium cellare ATCC 36951]
MASGRSGAQPNGTGDAADLEKAFQELAKGERTATALENQLSKMEARIQALLDQAESQQREFTQLKGDKASSNGEEQSGHQDDESDGKKS